MHDTIMCVCSTLQCYNKHILVFIEKCDIKITTKLGLSIVSFYIWIKAVEKFKGKFSLFLKIVLLLYIYLIICTSKYNNLMQPFMCAQLKMVK